MSNQEFGVNVSDSNKKNGAGKVDQDLIRDLANLLSETNLSEIEVEQNGLRLRVARQAGGAFVAAAAPAPVAASTAALAPAAPAEGDYANHPGAVISPMVGTIYTSSEPDAPAFIREGDQVTEGQTLLIVEAMKTMNNIPAPKAGRVAKILVSNEQPIEFGEVLVIIE